ncbi:hypothetical protein ES703_23605 [subsurface metagenome]
MRFFKRDKVDDIDEKLLTKILMRISLLANLMMCSGKHYRYILRLYSIALPEYLRLLLWKMDLR